jgi:hypothetical protein
MTMKFRNLANSAVEVELISDDVEILIGETKWPGVAYIQDGKRKMQVITKARFKSRFVPIDATP